MKEYLDVLRQILRNNTWTGNRTAVRTISEPGLHLRLDMRNGFPALTTRKLPFKMAAAEILGYMRCYTSAADFRALGTTSWDKNANQTPGWLANPYRQGTDSLGPVYGEQLRHFPGYKLLDMAAPGFEGQLADAKARGYNELKVLEDLGEEGKTYRMLLFKSIDQVREAMDKLIQNPTDRRMVFHSWNPAQNDEVALPSCPSWWQLHAKPHSRELSLMLYVRSSDVALGLSWNLAQSALLLHLIARLTGYTPSILSVTLGDAHIYESHMPMVEELLKRDPLPLPTLKISERVPEYAKTGKYEPQWLELVEPSDFELVGYQHHGPLTAPMVE